MKRWLPFLLLFATPTFAQNPGTFMPSCRASFTFSATGRGPTITQATGNVTGFNNVTPTGSVNTHCAGWTLSYAAIGFSALSIEVDSAPDASTTTVGTTPGSWTIWPAAQVAANQGLPLTSTTGGAVTVFGFFPWVSINVTTATCPAVTTCQGVAFLYGWQVQGSQESNTGATQVQGVSNGNPVRVAAVATASTGSVQTQVESSAQGAASATNCTLTGAAGKFTYLSGFQVLGGGATAGSSVNVTVTGLTTTMNYTIQVPTGTAVNIPPLVVSFNPPIASSAVNTNIVVNVPSFGAGSTGQSSACQGFLQ